MSDLIRQTTELAMYLIRGYVQPGDTVIDATCGNGFDTLHLAGMEPGRLFAFDVQEQAVSATRDLLSRKGWAGQLDSGAFRVECMGHEHMASFFSESDGFSAQAIVFNLGYLPGGDRTLTTKTSTTLAAIRDALKLLSPGGLLCVTMYSGHPEGAAEKSALLDFARDLDGRIWHVGYVSFPNQKKDPPEILLVTRKR